MANEDDVKLLDSGETDLSGCDFSGLLRQYKSYSGRNFSGANLEGAHFLNCDLSSCDFSGANISKAKFDLSSFIESEFVSTRGINISFEGAILDRAKFRSVNGKVNFVAASLLGTDFSGTIFLQGVDFEAAQTDAHTNFEDVQLPRDEARQEVFKPYSYQRQKLRRIKPNDDVVGANIESPGALSDGLVLSGPADDQPAVSDSAESSEQQRSESTQPRAGGFSDAFSDGFAKDQEPSDQLQNSDKSSTSGVGSETEERARRAIAANPIATKQTAVSLQSLIASYIEDPPRPNDPTSQQYVAEAVELFRRIQSGLDEIVASIEASQDTKDTETLARAAKEARSLGEITSSWLAEHGVQYLHGTTTIGLIGVATGFLGMLGVPAIGGFGVATALLGGKGVVDGSTQIIREITNGIGKQNSD